MLIITDLFDSFLHRLLWWLRVPRVACTALFMGLGPGCSRRNQSRTEGYQEEQI